VALSLLQSLSEDSEDVDTNVSALHLFTDKVRNPVSGRIRYILRLTPSTFKNVYLPRGGNVELVKLLSDEDIEKFTSSPLNGISTKDVEIQVMNDNFTFQQMIKPKVSRHDTVVIIDTPVSYQADLEKNRSDVSGARQALTEILNHRFYVMAISSSKAAKIGSKVSKTWNSLDDLMLELDPFIVIAYPNRTELAQIVDQYGELAQDRQAEVDSQQAAQAAAAAPVSSEPSEEDAASLKSRITAEEDADFTKAVNRLAGYLNGKKIPDATTAGPGAKEAVKRLFMQLYPKEALKAGL
jgi:hypothetical protein